MCPWSRLLLPVSPPFSWRLPSLGHLCVPASAILIHRQRDQLKLFVRAADITGGQGHPSAGAGITRNAWKHWNCLFSEHVIEPRCSPLKAAVMFSVLWRAAWMCSSAKYCHFFIVCFPFYDFLYFGFMTGCGIWKICSEILVWGLSEKGHNWNRTSLSASCEVSKKCFHSGRFSFEILR